MLDFRAGTGKVQNKPKYLDPEKQQQADLADICRASANGSRGHALLKWTENILQDGPQATL